MPMYDYHCQDCMCKFELCVPIAQRDTVKCRNCGGNTTRLISRTKDDWFRPFVSEDFTGKPIEVRSKEHYKQLCKEHNVYAPHCFGQGFNISEI